MDRSEWVETEQEKELREKYEALLQKVDGHQSLCKHRATYGSKVLKTFEREQRREQEWEKRVLHLKTEALLPAALLLKQEREVTKESFAKLRKTWGGPMNEERIQSPLAATRQKTKKKGVLKRKKRKQRRELQHKQRSLDSAGSSAFWGGDPKSESPLGSNNRNNVAGAFWGIPKDPNPCLAPFRDI